jgi:superfamily II DNA or RNA helicase
VPDRAAAELSGLAFAGAWRRYQLLALEAFERDRAAGRPHTHLVAPPGSGKTVLGIEMVRRIGKPALALVPNTAIQAQWLRSGADSFGAAPGVFAAEPGAPVACLTYQALSRLEDPGAGLRSAAEARWTAERAASTGEPVEAVTRDAAGWAGAAAERRERELARIVAALKREIARGEHAGIDLGALLGPGAQERIAALRAAGVATLVLDECHHLASLWGYVVREVVARLGDVHLIGLTATPPDELTADESDLYAELLGPVDFTVPTPAVVRDGYLAPYQELAWLTEPLAGERAWLAERDTRFRELVTALLDGDRDGATDLPGFGEWVVTRLRYRETEAGGRAELPWADFQRRRPALARAGVRFLASAGLEPPPGAPRGESYRQPPDLEDWLALLEDYAQRGLRAHPSPRAAERLEAIAAALRDLGFTLTRTGIRRGTSDIDRVLTSSGAKSIGLVEVLAAESDARGDGLRGLVLCDAERATRRTGEAGAVLDPAAGTAPGAVLALAGDLRTAPLRPLLVTGRGLAGAAADADAQLTALAETAPGLGGWRAEDGEDGLVRLAASGPEWTPRAWVRAATVALAGGATRALVGTRALLGEGWDAPCLNCVVDLTSATTSVSVRQMRGRSLRLDPAAPDKIASNWDVVCVAPDLARGAADYRRFVAKHRHLFAPCEDGAIEAGPSHVHPALGPFAPPPAGAFAEIDRAMIARAAAHVEARERWAVGTPYAAAELESLVVRRRGGADGALAPLAAENGPAFPVALAPPLAVGSAGALAGVAGVLVAGPAALAGVALIPAAAAWALVRRRRAAALLPAALPLGRAARALADAYQALGELRPEAAASLELEPRASGYLRCALPAADPAESARFAAALEELLGEPVAPRYVISRLVARDGPWPRLTPVWHGAPADLGRARARAEAFALAWQEWLGPSELRFTQRTDAGREARALAAAEGGGWDVRRRTVWV